MPVVNPLARELVFKVVYYGPGLGGKTTSLQHIYATTRPEHRGKMVSLATPVDRTLYFDFLPIRLPSSRDLTVRLQLFTVPGQVYYNATRKLVLTGADGVVFVVDSQRARADANIESLRNLEENLIEHGRGLDEIPHVFSYNKRDLPGLVSIDDMERLLNAHGAPSFATVATSGEGVYETLEAITRAVLEDFEHRMPEHRGLGPSQLMLPEGGLAEALRMADYGNSNPVRETVKSTTTELGFGLPSEDDVGEAAARAVVEVNDDLAVEPRHLPSEPSEVPIALTHAKRVTLPIPNADSPSESPVFEHPETSDEIASPVDAMSKVVASLHASPKVTADHWAIGATQARAISTHTTPLSMAARVDTRSVTSDVEQREGESLVSRVEREVPSLASRVEREVPSLASRVDASIQAESVADQSTANLSFASLWADDERDTVLRIESAILSGEIRDALLLLDVLVQRSLEEFGAAMGQATLDPHVLMLMLGVQGESILEFRNTCALARTSTAQPSTNNALTALVFAAQLRLHMRRTRTQPIA